ncbi:extracellular solute-binding protein [Clostridium sp.]|uniref:extracellular solute-binding protein n=1 Tax=Clostridium sp. TaxID=1506 RepID=UPI0025BF6FEC|nr:extracellular solute-binding protein [Clostridium sp.]MCI9069357.1 extracellular solute-binding protein [Clostridium sp.]
MKRKLIRNIIICMTLITLTGCSSPQNQNKDKDSDLQVTETSKKSGYIEKVLKMPPGTCYIMDIKKINTGEIMTIIEDENLNKRVFISSDCGENWSEVNIDRGNLPTSTEHELFSSILSNGKIISSFTVLAERIEDESNQYFITNENMEFEKVNLNLSQTSTYWEDMPIKFMELNNGDLIGLVRGNTLIQIDKETYTERHRYKVDSEINGFSNVDDLLIITVEDEMISYNINTGEKENSLNELMDNIKEIPGEKDIISAPTEDYLYYCNNSNLYKYDLENNKSEKVISNSKYINNKSLYIDDFIKINETDYIFLMNNRTDQSGNLVLYKYSDDISNEVEENEIKIYSLLENSSLSSFITQLNMKNSDISIKYECGITEGKGVEISDAIKLLNTEIMAGKGPDIIILDDLPVDSYIENGLLADIKDIVVSNESDMFKGMLNAYEKDGKVYEFPLSISVPVFLGNKDLLKEVNNLDSLLNIIKEKSKESESRIFEYLGTPEEFIRSFYFIFENNWIDENNKINKAELTSFLEKCEEIYKISKEKDDIYQKEINEALNQMQIEGVRTKLDKGDGYLYNIDVNGMRDRKNTPLFAYGSINGTGTFENLYNFILEKGDMSYEILKNDNKNIFYPISKIGINGKSKNIDAAKEILKELLNSNIYSQTLTPNKEKFINSLKGNLNTEEYKFNSENNHYLKYVDKDMDDDGNVLETPIYFLNDDDINDITTRLDKLDIERKTNIVLITEVEKQFVDIIEGKIKPEAAAKKIINNVEVYLNE